MSLSPAKAALLERWRSGAPEAAAADAITPREHVGAVPLSFAQQRIWFFEQMQPGTATFNLSFCARVHARLDAARLESALGELAARHEALRTAIGLRDGIPCQVVAATGAPPLEVRDAADEAEALAHVGAAIHRPFDLAAGPLARVQLCRLATHDLLGLVVHHLVADGWSLTIALRELSKLYEGRALDPLPIGYRDFAAWERNPAREEDWSAALDDWVDRLRDAPPLELVTDKPRPAVLSARGDAVELRLSRGHSDALRALARAAGATPFMALLTAYAVVLAKLSGADDLVVGANVANRAHPETAGVIGNFANAVPLRIRLDGDPTFRELLDRVRATCLHGFGAQALPFERLVAELDPERDLSRSVLFQALLILQPPLAGMRFAGAQLEQVEVRSRTARADVELHLWDRPELHGSLVYSSDLFERATIDRLARRLRLASERMVAAPGARLSTFTPLLEEERSQLARSARGPRRDWPPATLHELAEQSADRVPDAVAVRTGSAVLTYAELDRGANRLARHLRALGAGPERRVGVCLRRSEAMVVAVLGVLKAGAAYVPLDERLPPARLALIAADAGIDVIVTEERQGNRLASTGAQLVRLDADAAAIAARAASRPAPALHPDALAYVVYTSGSTGTPKGVEIPHRAAAGFVRWVLEEPGLRPGERMATVSSLAFDASVAELFPSLAAGATLVIATLDDVADGARLRALLAEHEVDALLATPTVWRLLLAAGGAPNRRLRALCGAEAATPDLTDALAAAHDSAWNLYGPTETTVWASADRLAQGNPVALGRPVANARIHLLDATLREVPVGAPGEIFIGGPGLARGYLGRPGLTAERFVPDAFAAERGARLYRTGDLARYRLDGSLEFLGRRDHQVKLRGHRIELGEIEATLEDHPAVARAVSSLEQPGSAAARLVAHVVLEREHGAPGAAALAGFLRERLPDYMVPAAFAFLDRLPTTQAGKLDRRALPPLEERDRDTEAAYVAPRTPLEAEVAALAARYLGVRRVGVEDNFFDLGGHSLLAARLVTALRARHDVELNLQKLFVTPTVAGLAQAIAEELDRARELRDEEVRLRRIVAAMPEDQVDALLERLLADEGSKA